MGRIDNNHITTLENHQDIQGQEETPYNGSPSMPKISN